MVKSARSVTALGERNQLISKSLLKALEIIETIRKSEFVSFEMFSDGSGHILDDQGNVVLDWNNIDKLEESITQYIHKRGKYEW